MAIDRSVYEFYRKKLLLQLANEHSGLLGVILSEVCDDDRCCVFFMIGGKADKAFPYVGEKF